MMAPEEMRFFGADAIVTSAFDGRQGALT